MTMRWVYDETLISQSYPNYLNIFSSSSPKKKTIIYFNDIHLNK